MVRKFTVLGLAVSLPLAALGDESWNGIVKKEPQGEYAHWYIGSQQLDTNAESKIKERAGRLEVGACARVTVAGAVIESVKTEPMHDCDNTDYEAYFESFRVLGEQGS